MDEKDEALVWILARQANLSSRAAFENDGTTYFYRAQKNQKT